jgi:hypothetical protein
MDANGSTLSRAFVPLRAIFALFGLFPFRLNVENDRSLLSKRAKWSGGVF